MNIGNLYIGQHRSDIADSTFDRPLHIAEVYDVLLLEFSLF